MSTPTTDIERSRYAAYPDHSLRDIDPAVLAVARDVLDGAAEWNDVDPEMSHPIADGVVQALLEAGHLNAAALLPPVPAGGN